MAMILWVSSSSFAQKIRYRVRVTRFTSSRMRAARTNPGPSFPVGVRHTLAPEKCAPPADLKAAAVRDREMMGRQKRDRVQAGEGHPKVIPNHARMA